MIVYGEFRGKNMPDNYKIRFLSGSTPTAIERDLEISRELSKLDIKR